jgi:hypothetical protein
MTENSGGGGLLSALHIPCVAVRTPSDESNRSSSFNGTPSRRISTCDAYNQTPSSNTCTSVRKTVKNFFRSSKTTDNMSAVLLNGNNILTNLSKYNRTFFKLKSSSHLSHSQPIVTENLHSDSPFIDHSEQTPLIERRNQLKHQENSNNNNIQQKRLNRQGLHLQLDIDCLPRSRSCTDGIILPANNQESDSINPTTTTTNLQPNQSEAASLRSSASTVSSLSTYQQQLLTQQTKDNVKNEINKSQESIFSLPSPVQKQRSMKSLIMAATTKDKATKQDNDVLVLIASWVLRSPEDFQGIKKKLCLIF